MSHASDLELRGIRLFSRRLPRLRVFRYLARVYSSGRVTCSSIWVRTWAVGPEGKVVAVEADARTHARLIENVRLNQLSNVVTFRCGVSDRAEIRKLSINVSSNRGASSFLVKMGEEVEVECLPLSAVLDQAGGNTVELLQQHGYRIAWQARDRKKWPNFILLRE